MGAAGDLTDVNLEEEGLVGVVVIAEGPSKEHKKKKKSNTIEVDWGEILTGSGVLRDLVVTPGDKGNPDTGGGGEDHSEVQQLAPNGGISPHLLGKRGYGHPMLLIFAFETGKLYG